MLFVLFAVPLWLSAFALLSYCCAFYFYEYLAYSGTSFSASYSEYSFNRIRPGDTEAKVKALIGEPLDKVEVLPGGTRGRVILPDGGWYHFSSYSHEFLNKKYPVNHLGWRYALPKAGYDNHAVRIVNIKDGKVMNIEQSNYID